MVADAALIILLLLQEVFLTPHHLGIAMEYVDGGDLAAWVQMNRIPDVSSRFLPALTRLPKVSCDEYRGSLGAEASTR